MCVVLRVLKEKWKPLVYEAGQRKLKVKIKGSGRRKCVCLKAFQQKQVETTELS